MFTFTRPEKALLKAALDAMKADLDNPTFSLPHDIANREVNMWAEIVYHLDDPDMVSRLEICKTLKKVPGIEKALDGLREKLIEDFADDRY